MELKSNSGFGEDGWRMAPLVLISTAMSFPPKSAGLTALKCPNSMSYRLLSIGRKQRRTST